MAVFTITAVDTSGIQPFIFGSNRLQENIGASELVRLATGQWALDALADGASGHHNVLNSTKTTLNDEYRIESDESAHAAEVLYAGGGNIVALFRSSAAARDFARKLTRKLLEDAPGLSIFIAHHDNIDWDKSALSRILQNLLGKELAKHKAAAQPSFRSLGLGVTAACESTGLAASRTTAEEHRGVSLKLSNDEATRLISSGVAEKLVSRDLATHRLTRLFEDQLCDTPYSCRFPSDMDKLGRIKGEESYVAVVHADGNGVGRRIQKIAGDHSMPQDNRRFILAVRDFSRQLDGAANKALLTVVLTLLRSISWNEELSAWMIAGKIPLVEKYLPFRPLVFGGDDVTFVCNGQLGIGLAAIYLGEYERQTEMRSGSNSYLKDLHACAGVAIVKSHYPFARAYKISESLVRSAKLYIKEKYKEQKDASALDWHFTAGGLSGSLTAIRAREYTLPDKRTLVMRPVLLNPESNDQDGRAWHDRVERLTLTFQDDPRWAGKRNKVKALREALRRGPREVEAFRLAFELNELPEVLPGLDLYRKNGYTGNRCGYFDAIELLDHYVPLEVG
ncbi:MAG: hypothetical protein ABSH28_23305 [Acidobacteriota bacterium]|jgi:hypothetical protein